MARRDGKSWQTLRRLLAPLLARRVARRARARAAARMAHHITLPTVDAVKKGGFFATWPQSLIQSLLSEAQVQCYEAGCVVAFAAEPARCTMVFWVLSGKLTQLPTKPELAACASDNPRFHRSVHEESVVGGSNAAGGGSVVVNVGGGPRQARTGPCVLPRLFADTDTPAVTSLAPLSSQQEALLDLLQTYTAGQTVDLEPLVLGDLRRRSLRAQTAVVLLAFPLATLQARMAALTPGQLASSVQAAKDAVTQRLAHCDERPSALVLQDINPVLRGLEAHGGTLQAMRLQLEPYVFSAHAIICPDVYTADTVYFLHRGHAAFAHESASQRGAFATRGAAIGLHSFAASELPPRCGGRRAVKALTYCELWGIAARKLLRLCTEAEVAQCARLATQWVQAQLAHSPALSRAAAQLLLPSLRRVSVFGYLSDATLRVIADAFALRVYAPGECIVASGRTARCGVVCMTGRAYMVLPRRRGAVAAVAAAASHPFSPSRGNESAAARDDETHVTCGQPLFFAEALTGVHSPSALYAETSVLVQQCSPGAMLDALEEQLCSPEEVRVMLDEAERFVQASYGSERVAYMRGQASALQRVRAYRARMKTSCTEADEGNRRRATSEEKGEGGGVSEALQMQHELCTCLSLQLASLHQDPLEVERQLYLRNERGTAATLLPESATGASARHSSASASHAGANDAAVPGFTIDANGEVCLCHTTDNEARGQATPPPPPPLVVVQPNTTPMMPTGTSPRVEMPCRALVPIPTPPATMPSVQAKSRRAPRLRQLYVAPSPAHHHHITTAAAAAPPRLAAIDRAITRLSDEAVGFDARREYRQMLLRQRPTM